ncbi:MAG: hypothetical protein EU518_01485 [Promethearchaeota archaeon]|nr:MAG: hypothetical protein EU518_01485 [Candidatus Lokiarchaeota archaeon]
MEIQPVGKKSLYEFITSRRDIKNFEYGKISQETIRNIVECGRWAPLPKEGYEPWRVNVVIHPTVKQMIAETMDFEMASIISDANANFVILRKITEESNRDDDLVSIGAFIQNILLFAYSIDNLGAVLINSIKDQSEEILKIFKLPPTRYESIAIIAMGAIDKEMHNKTKKKESRASIESYLDIF